MADDVSRVLNAKIVAEGVADNRNREVHNCAYFRKGLSAGSVPRFRDGIEAAVKSAWHWPRQN